MVYTTPAQPKQSAKKQSFAVTPVHDLLLRDLNALQRATAEQLTRLNYRLGMLTTVKARLKDLTAPGYVLPLFHPSIRLPYMYALDRKGLNYLAGQDVDVREYFRPSQEEDTAKNFLFREHMLAISDLLIHALLFERFFKNHPIKATYQHNNRQETKTIVPDSYLAFVYTSPKGGEEPIPVLVELDRGTEDQKFFRKRIRAYLVFLKSRAFKTLFDIENITVAFATTRNHNRMKQMREWSQKELAVTNEPSWLSQLFLEPVWYTPAEDDTAVSLLGE